MTAIPETSVFDTELKVGPAKSNLLIPILNVLKETLGGAAMSELTINAESITPTGSSHTVDTEGDASSDDLVNIIDTNHPDGRIIILSCANNSRTVVLKHGGGGEGQLLLRGGGDVSLSNTSDFIWLQRVGTAWVEILRSGPQAATLIDGLGTASAARAAIEAQYPSGVYRNKVINGNFAINQRSVSGTVVLSAGEYGHDRWKAGSAGCTYTFVTVGNTTTITISAGSLVQVIEGEQIEAGTHALSWTGTVQFKIDGGAVGDSGMTATTTEGSNVTIETSGTGTVSKVQLEKGDIVTPFENPGEDQGLQRCQRYCRVIIITWAANASGTPALFRSGMLGGPMRALPTKYTLSSPTSVSNISSYDIVFSSTQDYYITVNPTAAGYTRFVNWVVLLVSEL